MIEISNGAVASLSSSRDIYLACYIQECSAMISKIVAVSVLGFCAVATVAWTTLLGWGLYELLH
jgi:hypothetical protein